MEIIGLTGGSGVGKGTVARQMRQLGAGWVDADAVYRTLCDTNEEMLDALDAAFGGVRTDTGALNRPQLASIVFASPKQLQRLNALTAPYIRAASLEALHRYADRPLVVYDAPTLFQMGFDSLCRKTVGVVATPEKRVARIMRRDTLSEQAAYARIRAQPDYAFYRVRCDYLIENNDDYATLRQKVEALYSLLLATLMPPTAIR